MPDLNPDSIAARLTDEVRDQINKAMNEQMRRESELGAYDLEAVRELGHHTI